MAGAARPASRAPRSCLWWDLPAPRSPTNDPPPTSRAVSGLELEQSTLARKAAGVAGQRPVLADHAVAGDDDRKRVLSVGGAYRAHGSRFADRARDRRIGGGRAVWNRAERRPDATLELRADRGEREIERAAPAVEIGVQLRSYFGERAGVFAGRRRHGPALVRCAVEVNSPERE